jgi:hypothetical protein
MENFHRLLGVLSLFTPAGFLIYFSDEKSWEYSVGFLLVFVTSIVYNVWLFKKYQIKLPKDIKDTHSW